MSKSNAERAGRMTLGLTIFGSREGRKNAGIGWALLSDGATTHRQTGDDSVIQDPAETALRRARDSGVQEIMLTRYLTDAAILRSDHARGMSLAEHGALIDRTRALLEANGFHVAIEAKA